MAPPIHLTFQTDGLECIDLTRAIHATFHRCHCGVRPSVLPWHCHCAGRRCLRVRPSLIMMRDRERRRLDDAAILRVRRSPWVRRRCAQVVHVIGIKCRCSGTFE